MSRAFVDEDSGDDEELPELPLPLPPGAKNYSTPEGAARLHDELRLLVEKERPRALAGVGGASGDEGATARRKLAELDRRIAYLGRMASLLEVVEPPENPGRVSFGLRVRVLEEGEPRTWRIVGVEESDPERGLLSWASPVARALMGRRVGETVTVRLPRGELKVGIVGIGGSDEA